MHITKWGSTVTLTAVPNTGYMFTRWSGDASGNTNPIVVAINNNKKNIFHILLLSQLIEI